MVAGVGRSGTSEVCRVLESLGVDFGGHGTVRTSNPDGDYEHLVLKQIDGHYLDGHIDLDTWRHYVEQAVQDFRGVWGYKYPRGVDMLDVYDEMWPDAEWIWVWRDIPATVASWSRWYGRDEASCRNSVKRRVRKLAWFFADKPYTLVDMSERRTEKELRDILRPIVVKLEGP